MAATHASFAGATTRDEAPAKHRLLISKHNSDGRALELIADGRLLVVMDGQRAQLWDWTAVRAKFRRLGIDWQD